MEFCFGLHYLHAIKYSFFRKPLLALLSPGNESCKQYYIITLPSLYIYLASYSLTDYKNFRANRDNHAYETWYKNQVLQRYTYADYWGTEIFNKKCLHCLGKTITIRRAKEILVICCYYSIEEFLNSNITKCF